MGPYNGPLHSTRLPWESRGSIDGDTVKGFLLDRQLTGLATPPLTWHRRVVVSFVSLLDDFLNDSWRAAEHENNNIGGWKTCTRCFCLSFFLSLFLSFLLTLPLTSACKQQSGTRAGVFKEALCEGKSRVGYVQCIVEFAENNIRVCLVVTFGRERERGRGRDAE